MKLAKEEHIDMLNKERFIFRFKVLFEGACEYSYDELIEKATSDYGSLKEFFKTVKFFWNEFFERIELECEYGDGWLGFMMDDYGGIFSYIEDTDYELVNVYPSGFHEFTLVLSIPRKYKLVKMGD